MGLGGAEGDEVDVVEDGGVGVVLVVQLGVGVADDEGEDGVVEDPQGDGDDSPRVSPVLSVVDNGVSRVNGDGDNDGEWVVGG